MRSSFIVSACALSSDLVAAQVQGDCDPAFVGRWDGNDFTWDGSKVSSYPTIGINEDGTGTVPCGDGDSMCSLLTIESTDTMWRGTMSGSGIGCNLDYGTSAPAMMFCSIGSDGGITCLREYQKPSAHCDTGGCPWNVDCHSCSCPVTRTVFKGKKFSSELQSV